MSLLPGAQEHILQQEDGKKRFVQVVTNSRKPSPSAPERRSDRDSRRHRLLPSRQSRARTRQRGERKIRAKTRSRHPPASRARRSRPKARSSTSSPPPDLKQPDISILSDQFLAEVRGLKYKNVAAELLAKLLGTKSRSARSATSCKAASSPRCSRRRSTPITTAPSPRRK